MKIITYINAHKILVPPVVLALMGFYNNWSAEAFIYLSLHGTYCALWLMKSSLFPDRRFEEKIPHKIGIPFIFLPLAGYYLAPYFLISRHIVLAPWVIGFCLTIYILGIFYHYVSDAQKHFTLQLRKGLIEDGLFGRTRNPNYLGEILIYLAFAILSWHWIPFLVLGGWVFGFFLRNMLAKDQRLARHAGFAEYQKRSGLLLPKFFRSPVAAGSHGSESWAAR